MYWWHVSKLAEDLRDGRVDEKERFKYFLATFIAYNIAVQLFIYTGGPFDIDSLVSTTVNFTVAVIGIILCYRTNKSGDNSDFIPRMVCLGWPVGVQLLMVLSSVLLLMGFFFALHTAIFGPGFFLSAIPDLLRKMRTWLFGGAILGILIILPYYLRIWAYITLAARPIEYQSDLPKAARDLSDVEIVLGLVGGIGALIIIMCGMVFLPTLVGLRAISELFTYLASILWFLSSLWIGSWLHRRATKHTLRGVRCTGGTHRN